MPTVALSSTRPRAGLFALLGFCLAASTATAQTDHMYFPAVDNVTSVLVQRINAETVRIDMSAWYLSEHAISIALVNRFLAGVPVRLIGDRGSIFEIDANTRKEFYWLASQGVPIRLRYNPTWFPEIDHWKASIFVGQGLVEFGSANYTPFQLAPVSTTNYSDETAWLTSDATLVGAFKTKFDQIWNDTTLEPQSIYGGPPYLKNWNDACVLEAVCSDYKTLYPNPAPMNISTARLEPDRTMPADLIWGQGSQFNNRLVQEINNETTRVDFVIYRLTVDSVTQALLSKFQSGVPLRLIIEPKEYLNSKWPEFWLTHANIDKLWAAGVSIKQRQHQGLTHMKTIVTSRYATNASSNFAAAWERDNNYFVSASARPAIYQALADRFATMWADTAGFTDFVPQPPATPTLAAPGNGTTGLFTRPTLTWNIATFAVNYDVYLGTSSTNMVWVANVPAQLNNNPPATYSWTPTSNLAAGTTYFWRVVARTNATPRNPNLVANSATWSFSTSGTASPPPPSSLPSPWVDQDIGAVGTAGGASFSNGVFSVSGAGADIWGSADSFNFAFEPLSGDGQIVARVTSLANTNAFAKAGVMMRETTAAGSAHVLLDVRPGGAVEFMQRSSTGGATTFLAGATQSMPTWLKLARSGSTVTASVSADGTNWTTVGSTPVTMASSLVVGLAVCSHTTSATTTGTFDNVAAGALSGGGGGGTATLPSPWQHQDIGSTGVIGSASYASGQFTVNGAGADIWGTADAFQYVYQPLAGDGQIVARVASLQNTNSFDKAGVMLRESLTAGSAHVIVDVRPGGAVEFMSRASTNGSTAFLGGATQTMPAWLRLTRSGSTVTSAVSADGSTWTAIGSTTVSMASTIFAGLAVSSHSTTATTAATFDSVTVGAGGGAPPPPPPSATDVVIYASDIPASALHGSWSVGTGSGSPNGVMLATPNNGFSSTTAPLASPTDYVDVTFNAVAGTPYRLWLRLQALNNDKFNDSVYVQMSDAQAYPIGSTSGLTVNLATDGTGSSLSGWGWQNGAYWLSQQTSFTFSTTGTHTIRIQVREDGVAFDQIVLSPSRYLSSPPGPVSNDATTVSKQ